MNGFYASTHTSIIHRNATQVTAAELRKAQAAAEAGRKAAEEDEGSLAGMAKLVGLLPTGEGAAEEDEESAAGGASVASGSSKGSRSTKGSGRRTAGKAALGVGRCVFCDKEFKLCGAFFFSFSGGGL